MNLFLHNIFVDDIDDTISYYIVGLAERIHCKFDIKKRLNNQSDCNTNNE